MQDSPGVASVFSSQILALFAVCFFFLIGFSAAEVSASDEAYEKLKTRYMSLRNTDQSLRRKDEWLATLNGLESFAYKNPSSKKADLALYQAALMSLRIFEISRDENFLTRTINLLREVPAKFPEGAQADDALLKLSDVQLNIIKDQQAAESSLSEIIERYPGGDMIEAAEIKLAALQGEAITSSSQRKKVELPEDAPVVVIDPGHGGDDFGAVGVGGLFEKDVVLDISRKTVQILAEKYGVRALLTRRADEFVPLYQRMEFANQNKSKIFVSIHANASVKSNMKGMEIYYLDNTGDQASKKLAERENASLQFEGPEADLRYMLSDLIQDTKLDDSIALGKVLTKQLAARLKQENNYPIKNLGVKKGPFYVLVGAHMPCVLVELAFIDHPEEGRMLAERAIRQTMAEALAAGIAEFLKG